MSDHDEANVLRFPGQTESAPPQARGLWLLAALIVLARGGVEMLRLAIYLLAAIGAVSLCR